MTFSIGQNFFKDLLESSNKRTDYNDKKSITHSYQLVKRLQDFYVNNNMPILLKSEKYSGMKDLLGETEPLGGHINFRRCGARNAPGSCIDGFPDEYNFWGNIISKQENSKDKKKQDNSNEKINENFNNIIEQPKLIENFSIVDHKENFDGNNKVIIIIIIIILIILITFFIYFKHKS